MTTIAYDGTTIAWDTHMTDKYGVRSQCAFDKVTVDKGRIFAAAGNIDSCFCAVQWIKKGAKLKDWDKIMPPGADFEMVVIDLKKGPVYYSDSDRTGIPLEAPLAIGSGADFALGAIAAGMSASEAVGIATKFDVYTGINVKVMNVHDALVVKPAPKPRRAKKRSRVRAR